MSVSFGMGYLPEHPHVEATEFFRVAEELDYDCIWIANEGLYRDTFVTLCSGALSTRKIGLGTAVLDPYTRHPGRMAISAATVDEASGGRMRIGIGAGGSAPVAFGCERRSPVDAVREAIHVMRGLWRGDLASPFEGRLGAMRASEMEFSPLRNSIPIFVAARRRRLLELAGEIGDGVMIGGYVTTEALTWCKERTQEGAARVGRDLADFQTLAWVYTSISDDGELARRAVSRLVVTSLLTSGEALAESGLEVTGSLRDHFDRNQWQISEHVISGGIPLLTDFILESLSMSGTPDECVSTLVSLLKNDVDHVVVLPFTTPKDDKLSMLHRFQEDVIPRARAALS